jgi:hypothetical protein
MASQWPAGLAAGIPFSAQAESPNRDLGWSPGELPIRIEEVVPTGLTHLGLTEDMVLMQCTYEWDEELILEELAAFGIPKSEKMNL